MKILHVVSKSIDTPGGVEIYLKNLVEHQIRQGMEVNIVSTDTLHGKTGKFIIDGVNVYYLKNLGTLWNTNPIYILLPFLVKYAREYDLVHVHSYIFFSSIQAVLACKFLGVPVILTLHGGVQTAISGDLTEKIQIAFKNIVFDKLFGRVMIKIADGLTSVSRADLKAVPTVFRTTRDGSTFWVSNAVSLERFRPPSREKQREGVLFVGRLNSIKGFDLFIEILDKLAAMGMKVPVHVVGDGEMKDLLGSAMNRHSIHYYKKVPYDEMPGLYRRVKVYVLSSRVEGMPTTVLEAMASGTPVVASDVGGVADVIKDGENGFLHAPLDTNRAAKNVARLLLDEQAWLDISIRGLETAGRFSWSGVASRFKKIYLRVLGEKKRKGA